MGLETLYPKPGTAQPDSCIVDIIAVHGLNGDPVNTWKHPKTNHFWLQDSLPLDVKGARILNYGYNADVVFGNSTADIWDHAKSLLGALIDERDKDDESRRPIIFIAHSLGGIIVKQALVWAQREPQYQTIRDHTLGVVFFGTPHQGVMHKPKSKLINALQSNSETLTRLTSEFKFEAPRLRILTFYELKPIGVFSGLIVEKKSALLELSHEDTLPVDGNHRDMCKFDSRNDETYKKLVKRLNRMLKGKDEASPPADCTTKKLHNKHFELPFDVSPYFTGRDHVTHELRENCFLSEECLAGNTQRRFILYGLGGSGKTQVALKFANNHRERYGFWGVFFIDTSSADMAEQGFSKMARLCKVGERAEDFKRYLTNSLEPWLLILDNADDPLLDISQFFPVGNRGIIIVTSRNPETRCHATIGSIELREMESGEAIDLLLRSGDLPCADQSLRDLALPIVQTLGHLALAVNHAGASIRQRICSLEEYLDHFTRHRKKLLSNQAVQAASEYNYAVYTTWNISIESIKRLAENGQDDTAVNALDLLGCFGFCHFDGITENIFRSASKRFGYTERHPWWRSNVISMISNHSLNDWDSLAFNEATRLLSRYALIHISGSRNRISLHPLVHSWIRDSMNEELHLRWWNTTISTLALASDMNSESLQRQLKAHLDHCIGVRRLDDLFVEDDAALDRLKISIKIVYVYERYPWKDGLTLSTRALEYSQKVFGDESYWTYHLTFLCAEYFIRLSQYQHALNLLQGKVEVSSRVAGPADPLTLHIMQSLSWTYRILGRNQEALDLAEQCLRICKNSLDEGDETYLKSLDCVARVYIDLGRYEEAVDLHEKAVRWMREYNDEDLKIVVYIENSRAVAYADMGQHQVSLECFQRLLKKCSEELGEDHFFTVKTMIDTAFQYGNLDRPEDGISLIIEALDIGSRIGLDSELIQEWEENLEWLESLKAHMSATTTRTLPKSQKSSHPEPDENSSGRRWKFWRKYQRQIEGSSLS